jgi:hypothetical protein
MAVHIKGLFGDQSTTYLCHLKHATGGINFLQEKMLFPAGEKLIAPEIATHSFSVI